MNDELIESWCAWYVAGGASAGTLRVRRNHLRRLARTVDLVEARTSDLVAFLGIYESQAPESRKSALMSLRSFYRWAVDNTIRTDDPTRQLRAVKVPAGVPKPIGEVALETALAQADDQTRLMLLLGGWAGLRRAEIARVHADDVTPFGLIVRGKGGRVRRVPIHPRLAPELAKVSGWAFASPVRPGDPVGPDYVADRLERVLPAPHTAHSLRHRFATMAYRGSHDLRAVQQLLGHTDPATTARYTLVGEDELVAAVGAVA